LHLLFEYRESDIDAVIQKPATLHRIGAKNRKSSSPPVLHYRLLGDISPMIAGKLFGSSA
jgi:hypothetical protein